MREGRTDEAIRADLTTVADICGAVVECDHGLNVRIVREATTRLLADVDQLLADRDRLETAWSARDHNAQEAHQSREYWRGRAATAEADRDRLRAENERLTEERNTYSASCLELVDDLAAARAELADLRDAYDDAERRLERLRDEASAARAELDTIRRLRHEGVPLAEFWRRLDAALGASAGQPEGEGTSE